MGRHATDTSAMMDHQHRIERRTFSRLYLRGADGWLYGAVTSTAAESLLADALLLLVLRSLQRISLNSRRSASEGVSSKSDR